MDIEAALQLAGVEERKREQESKTDKTKRRTSAINRSDYVKVSAAARLSLGRPSASSLRASCSLIFMLMLRALASSSSASSAAMSSAFQSSSFLENGSLSWYSRAPARLRQAGER